MRARRRRALGLLVVAAVGAALGHQSLTSSSPTLASTDRRGEQPARSRAQDDVLGESDGAVPDRTSVFDDGVPGVARLDPALLAALRRATIDAAGDGVELVVDSGWRSPAYQQRLREQAVLEYGSDEAAARWVATPETSAHVTGEAVDIGPSDAAAWLSAHGAGYGLCRIYGNEPWHYERRPEAVDHGCPPQVPDATYDPRSG